MSIVTEKYALVVDDEPKIRTLISRILETHDWSVTACSSAEEAISLISLYPWQLVFCDVVLGGTNGYEVLRRFSVDCPKAQFILMTGHGSGAGALDATAIGAHDYLSKPFSVDQILGVSQALGTRLASEEAVGETTSTEPAGYESDLGLIGNSPEFIRCLKLVGRVAPTDLPVLISGDSGTGKEVVARAIHRRSSRAEGPFVPVNCGAIPVELIESELFGHTKGSFTGADRERPGLWEEADGGTIFLDEITETGPLFQVKLLRALQEREIRRVGSNKSISVDVRIIAATNRNIEDQVKAGGFRQDLMYRLNVISIELPRLRDRKQDIILLAEHFVRASGKPVTKISQEASEILIGHRWDGNIRELENAILGAVALADQVIYPEHLPSKMLPNSIPPVGSTLPMAETIVRSTLEQGNLVTLAKMQELYTAAVLEHTEGNKNAAARILDIDRKTLVRIASRTLDQLSES
ncbi:MAG: sigma-54 dependent transcriptional regulator [Pyrinomonadaceae bacterium]